MTEQRQGFILGVYFKEATVTLKNGILFNRTRNNYSFLLFLFVLFVYSSSSCYCYCIFVVVVVFLINGREAIYDR